MYVGFIDRDKQIYVFFLQKVGPPIKSLSWHKSLLLGSGSMGTFVYVGVLEDGREVAVKMVLSQAGKNLAENEKDILSSIKCPHIVSYLRFMEDDIFIHLILDLCEETLKDLVNFQTAGYLKDHAVQE